MKQFVALVLLNILLLTISACGGNVMDVIIAPSQSEIYTEEEIRAGIDTAIAYFKHNFQGCTLKEIRYIGDEKNAGYQDFAQRKDAEDVLVLESSFDVDASGGDGSLNPNSTYTRWKWILARKAGGDWFHVDHGY